MMRVDTIDERLSLFRQMAEHSGLDADALSGVGEDEVLAAAQRCLGCRVGEECRAWLEEVPGNQPPAGFCRNVSRFQIWVEREISDEIHQLDTLIEAAERHPAPMEG